MYRIIFEEKQETAQWAQIATESYDNELEARKRFESSVTASFWAATGTKITLYRKHVKIALFKIDNPYK